MRISFYYSLIYLLISLNSYAGLSFFGCDKLIKLLQFKEQAPIESPENVEKIELNGQVYYVQEIYETDMAIIYKEHRKNRIIKVRKNQQYLDQAPKASFFAEVRSINELRRRGIKVPKIYKRYGEKFLIKEYIPGETLYHQYYWTENLDDIYKISRQLYGLAKKLVRKKISPQDLHSMNLVYHKNEKIWYIIDPGPNDKKVVHIYPALIQSISNPYSDGILFYFTNILFLNQKRLKKILENISESVFKNILSTEKELLSHEEVLNKVPEIKNYDDLTQFEIVEFINKAILRVDLVTQKQKWPE